MQDAEFQRSMTYPQGDIRSQMFDITVYSNPQLIRLIGQSKKGKSTTLRCYDTTITAKDTFIQLHCGPGDRKVICDVDGVIDILIPTELNKKRSRYVQIPVMRPNHPQSTSLLVQR